MNEAAAIVFEGLTRDFGLVRALEVLTLTVARRQVSGLLGHLLGM